MERLTQERGDRTWKLHHIAWYFNLLAFAVVLFWALQHTVSFIVAYHSAPGDAQLIVDLVIAAGLMVAALILLMGAGISRYQARTEGQHLELKLAINRLHDELGSLKRAAAKDSSDE